eukprot:NODE_1993_length_1726_cov_30.394885_g1700_i0.p1 GENE.NODE_1993_length_1726_cov_30.394885_g1700_i0~~NODE_1993_length_1726_cov_30.394885_g1700_i0.p1  ORF type:complete len:557 (-),score=88.96 NODE_1993_length_1726_cov_30.394885_g1700_i0:54-1559(-)
MSSYEVISTLAAHADYILASEDLTYGDGWDHMKLDPTEKDPVGFASTIFAGYSRGFQTKTFIYLPTFIQFDSMMKEISKEIYEAINGDNQAALTSIPRALSSVREVSITSHIVDLRSLLRNLESALFQCPLTHKINAAIRKLDESIIKYDTNRVTTMKGVNIMIQHDDKLFNQIKSNQSGVYLWQITLQNIEIKRNSPNTQLQPTTWCQHDAWSTHNAKFHLSSSKKIGDASGSINSFFIADGGISFHKGSNKKLRAQAKVHPTAEVSGRILLKIDHEVLNKKYNTELRENDLLAVAFYKASISVINNDHWAYLDMIEPIIGLFQVSFPPKALLASVSWLESNWMVTKVKYYDEMEHIPVNSKGAPTGEGGKNAELYAHWDGLHYRSHLFLEDTKNEIRPKINPGYIVPLLTVYRDGKVVTLSGWKKFHWYGRLRNVKVVSAIDYVPSVNVQKVVVELEANSATKDQCILQTIFSYPELSKDSEKVICSPNHKTLSLLDEL